MEVTKEDATLIKKHKENNTMTNVERGRNDKLLDGPGERFFESNDSEYRAVNLDKGYRKWIAEFVVATEKAADSRHCSGSTTTQTAITRAEEFLDANLTTAVSRSDLADVAGVSIRTLSRGFSKRHGIGPMEFFRARRLDAAYRCLLAAEAGSTRVTDVAVRYGFNQLGKFAVEYKRAFGESPSVTLNRRRLKGLRYAEEVEQHCQQHYNHRAVAVIEQDESQHDHR